MHRKLPLILMAGFAVLGVTMVSACSSESSGSPVRVETPVAPGAPRDPGTATPEGDPSVTLTAVGDVMLARTIGDAIASMGPAAPFANVVEPLAAADITFANLEMALTDRGTAQPKDFVFRAPPVAADGLTEAGIDVVSLANNHALDFGVEGLDDTRSALAERGVVFAGAGDDVAAATAAVTMERNDIRIAVLAFATFHDDSVSGFTARNFEATESRPGIAWADEERVTTAVAAAAASHDVVIVSMHWGDEYRDTVSNEQVALGRLAVDAGADLVLGHGPHVTQGWERYDAGLIVYSLGNFVFDLDAYDYAVNGLPSTHSLIFRAELGRDGVRDAAFVPVRIDPATGFPTPATGADEAAIRARLESLVPRVEEAIGSVGDLTSR